MKQEIKFIRSFDNTKIAYAISGSGPPVVKTATYITHLEHDWNSPVWLPFLTNMSRYTTLIRNDERGSGLSDWYTKDYSFEAWVKDLKAVVDAEKLDKFILYGQSQGASVAVAFAARYPERVEKLILVGGYARGWLHRNLGEKEKRQEQMLIDLMKVGWGEDNPAFRQFFTSTLMPGASADRVKSFDALMKISTEPEIAAILEREMHLVDVTREASNVSCPTLILHPVHDSSVPYAEGKHLSDLIPGSRFVRLDSKNHVLQDDEPAWTHFWQEVYQFMGVTQDYTKHIAYKINTATRVLRTIVFTDIVDSTMMALQLGDKQWTSLLENHNAKVRQHLKANEGIEINTTGDGFLLIFESPTNAITFAKSVMLDFRNENIHLRCGIHTGEIEYMDHDARGIHVHISARVTQEAGPDEICTTSTVKDLVEGSGISFYSKGRFKLKGLDMERELFFVEYA